MENEELAKKALKVLLKRSDKALRLAKKIILEEKMECKDAYNALKHYASKWNDTTRPGVVSMACDVVGGNSTESIPLQISLLLISAGLDIHDDIIDKSSVKNMEPTIYGKYGQEIALLLGIALIVNGFNHLYKAIESLPRDRKIAIINTAKDFLFEEIDAHILEVKLRNKKWDVKPQEYFHVLEKKAADIEGLTRIGALFGGGSPKEIEVLGKYGRKLGILLAVRSEFIDIFETSELTNRVKHECLPLPILCALQSNTHKSKILKVLQKEKIEEDDLTRLIETVYGTPQVFRLRQRLEKLKEEAIKTLEMLPAGRPTSELRLLVSSMTEDL